ncbi:TfIIFbeta [Drosophila busckii]|uniref:General transcription factor IIF subunit 2 n=1 Tax=Drosophila busckii TaxID=30019 RepID=A0A0M4EUX6_DROBS|nr:general transcription factor IIF subunit 2 [Drosophila busckii]ALC41332.1 TfIIFbeta [Drosophila busckii]
MSEENSRKRKTDMKLNSRSMWLVKMPNYVAQMWEQAPSDMEVATVRMQTGKSPVQVQLILSKELLALSPTQPIATELDLKISKSPSSAQRAGIFSTGDGETSIEGWVSHKMDCQPVCNAKYFEMKKESLRTSKHQRGAEPLVNFVKNYKPVSNHIENIEDAKRRKEAAGKCLNKETIMELLFQAFEKHQYYTLKDLQFITKQSTFILKAILKDIGDYGKDPAHKLMWELKEEYRHYQRQETSSKPATKQP